MIERYDRLDGPSLWAAAEGRPGFLKPCLSWCRDWGGLLTLAAALYTAAFLGWLWLAGAPQEPVDVVADAIFIPMLPLAALLAWRAGRRFHLDKRTRAAWRVVALGLLLWGLGDNLWFLYEIVLHSDPFPSPADAAYLAGYPALFCGLLLFPSAPQSSGDRWKFVLDAGVIFAGAAVGIWYFGLRPITAGGGLDTATVLSAAYPVGDAVLMFGVATLLLRRPAGGLGGALALLQAGLLATVAADVLFAYQSAQDTYYNGGWPDQLFALGDLLFIAAAQYHYWRAGRPGLEDAKDPPRPRASLLPFAAVFLAYGVLVAADAHDLTESTGVPIAGAGAITLLVVARQIVALVDNRRLLAEAKALAAELERREARFRSLVQNAPDVIVVLDANGRIVYESPSVQRVLGLGPEGRLGAHGLSNVHPDDLPDVQQAMAALVSQPGATRTFVCRGRHAGGSWRWLEVTATNLLHDPNVGGLVGNYRDITERRELEEKLVKQAFYDPLTGLPNRSLFRDRLAHAMARGQRYGEPISVLFLDLDDFKTVNDGLGHAAGDELLAQVAVRLRGCLREMDTPARLGGDEFAVLLEDAGIRRAKAVAGRLLSAFQTPFVVAGQQVAISGSIGIATYEHGPGSPDDLLRNADAAMYAAKSRGKNRAEVFEPGMYEAARSRLGLKADLQRAIDEGQLELHYQPILTLAGGQVLGLEALVRYRHPERGLVPPLEFIPLAEETGLILPIGRWVLREACRQTREWQERLGMEPPIGLSVNLSPRQIEDPNLLEDVTAALRESGLHPRDLLLEITESVLLYDSEILADRLRRLKELGVHLAIDDFGTGFSSLSYLQRLPLDFLKIDRSFVNELKDGAGASSLAGTIVALARSLGLRVIAEGVETEGQQRRLREMGCDMAQGFLYARPLPPKELEAWLRQFSGQKAAARAAEA